MLFGLAAIFATLLFLSRPQPGGASSGTGTTSAGSGGADRRLAAGAAAAASQEMAVLAPSQPARVDFSSPGAVSLMVGPETAGAATGPMTELAASLQAVQSATPQGISGVVRLAPQFADRISAGDTVVIYAREAGGKGTPVAAIRKRARHLPLTFFLDDSTSINPARPLSGHDRLVIGARVSRNGSDVASTGDLQGSLEAQYGAAGVVIVIDSEVR